jgi:hypothetical protein
MQKDIVVVFTPWLTSVGEPGTDRWLIWALWQEGRISFLFLCSELDVEIGKLAVVTFLFCTPPCAEVFTAGHPLPLSQVPLR